MDDLTGFEITKAVELPEPFGIVVLWGLVLPALFIFANALTQLAFKDALILKVRRAPATLVITHVFAPVCCAAGTWNGWKYDSVGSCG